MRRDVREEAQGKWRGILLDLGMTQKQLDGTNQPCPVCGGRDRFRFTNMNGNGTAYCSGECGGGLSGIELVKRLQGVDFEGAAALVRERLGLGVADAPPSERDPVRERQWRQEVWRSGAPITPGDPVDTYLSARGVGERVYPPVLRYAASCRYSETLSLPAMLAAVQDVDGNGVNVHRTYLTMDGRKADVETPRRQMPGDMPDGCAIRLAEPGEVMGVAEGIETALAAGNRFEVPTWAAVSATRLAAWVPPMGVREVLVFVDNDANFCGHAAGYRLAHRLALKGLTVSVHVAPRVGSDWADYARQPEGAS